MRVLLTMSSSLRILIGTAALSLAACASSPNGYPWPATVVTVEQVRPVKPMRLLVNYKIIKGVPVGTTVLRIHVNDKGNTQNVGILESSGHPNLDEAAINSAWEAKYRPYMIDGRAADVTLVMPVQLKP